MGRIYYVGAPFFRCNDLTCQGVFLVLFCLFQKSWKSTSREVFLYLFQGRLSFSLPEEFFWEFFGFEFFGFEFFGFEQGNTKRRMLRTRT